MVTHCAIDGYSRLIVYIQCSTNNRASTVLGLFVEAVQQHGTPSRIRVDQGGENAFVVRHMLQVRGEEQRSVLIGSSVHNQRIERLWRDMHRCVTSNFYRVFYHLENCDLLDPLNPLHIYAIHFVFLPRINRALHLFKEAWNNHRLRSEHGQTPNQLFVAGALRLQHAGLVALDFFDQVPDSYGMTEDLPLAEDEEGVVVPPTDFSLTDEQLHELQRRVDPLSDSENMGIDLYILTVDTIHSF